MILNSILIDKAKVPFHHSWQDSIIFTSMSCKYGKVDANPHVLISQRVDLLPFRKARGHIVHI